ncbi:MAG TPA: MFS transporter [Thermoleophilaceae bacterium]|jgi:MFS family permease|nr:MFS transporter [Thermoleophilaceae bacterium]
MRRLFLLVAAVVLVDTMFFAAVVPLLPFYSDEFDLSKTAAGVLTAAYPAGTFAGALPGGWLAARWGVKPTLLTGLALLGITSLAFGFADSIVLLDAARFVQGVGGACMWAAGMTWLVSAAPAERRGELIGSALAAAIIGVLFGPVLGGAATVVGTEVVFSGVSVVAAGLAVWAWRTPGVAPRPSRGLPAMLRALRRRDVLTGFWLFTLPALYSGVIDVLAPLRLDDLGASGVAIGAVFLITAAVEAVVSPLAGRLSDRRGRLFPIRAGLAGAAVMAVLLPLPGYTVLLGLAVLLTFVTLGGFWAPAMALLSDASENAGLDLALAFSISNLAWALGNLVGSGAGGAIADATVDAVPYAMLGVMCAVTLVGVISLGRSAPARSGAAS